MEKKAKIVIRTIFIFITGLSWRLKDIRLQIRPRQIFAILGPARSGKTTLLKSMNRLDRSDLRDEPHRPNIYLDEQEIYDPQISLPELRRRVGMVFDLPTALPLSIFENVAYGPRLKGLSQKRRLEEIVEKALRSAVLWEEVKDRLSSSAMSLSGGQQQRLCIARVLALEPEIIMLDEPCSGLDPISTASVERSLTELKEKYTVILVPHNIQQASRVADRVGFLWAESCRRRLGRSDLYPPPRQTNRRLYQRKIRLK